MAKKFKRPWGYYEVLSDAADHKVKRIVVEPGGRLSLQSHKLRNEHWFVVSGAGTASVNGKKHLFKAGCALNIPAQSKHRVQNNSDINLVIIEIQTGKYFGEDDIQRFEDDYGRV
jgi:mannose-6-phosphate isomerase